METLGAFLRALRIIVAYCREAGGVDGYDATVHGECDSSRRMNCISDRYKALLLASPGR
jgi:hypothetical protein